MIAEKELLKDLKSIGIEVKSIWDLANGFPNGDKVEPLLRKHYRRSKDLSFKEAIKRALESMERGLIEDLKQIGINVSSVWDLVNGPNNYDNALPVLLKHLKLAPNSWYKEGIVRALGVPRFKGATNLLIEEFRRSNDHLYKWAVANSLYIIAPKDYLDELITIMGDSSHGNARQMIALALGKIGDYRCVPVLIKSLSQDEVVGHTIEALGMVGDNSVIELIRPFTKHKIKWVKDAANRAIENIQRRGNECLT